MRLSPRSPVTRAGSICRVWEGLGHKRLETLVEKTEGIRVVHPWVGEQNLDLGIDFGFGEVFHA